jgi:hypothetical protein
MEMEKLHVFRGCLKLPLNLTSYFLIFLFHILSISIQSTATSPLRVMFLSSDTGGGHRASAESLGKQVSLCQLSAFNISVVNWYDLLT